VVMVLIAALAAGPIMSRVEQPKYDVIERDGTIEIRVYDSMIAAETSVSGDRKPAIEEGFRRIAGYIFGANKPRAKIANTAPVGQATNQKIAMTAPVTQQAGSAQDWTVSFIMPAEWTLQLLPEPNDARIKLVAIPMRKMIAITFSGTATDAAIAAKIRELRDYADRKNLQIIGEPVLAFYNPPWTLPLLRRNEVLFGLRD
jgi:SOUL heme-binding protein